jgi:YD repeat-containing protein
VYFSSNADNLDPSSSGFNIFVHDRLTGETRGIIGSADSYSISADGRYVAFTSSNSTLVANDTNNGQDVFVYDRDTRETTRVSVNSDGVEGGYVYTNSTNVSPAISADGRFIAFASFASNLVANDTNMYSYDLFIHDRQTGQTTIANVDSRGLRMNLMPNSISLSADGRFITFEVGNFSEYLEVYGYIHDNLTGETTQISFQTFEPEISADGKFVAFRTWAGIFVENRETGEITRVDVSSNGETANSYSRSPSISADGRFVAFISDASNLVSGDTNNRSDIFVRDRLTNKTVGITVGQDLYPNDISFSISANGESIAFSGGDGQSPYTEIFVVNNPFLDSTNLNPSNTVNRLAREINANGAVRKYAYDAVGNITSITDRDGTIQKFTYDKLNRRTQEQWFDVLGNLTRNIVSTYNAAGELTSITDPDSTYSYTYDLDGRMLAVSNEGTPNLPTTIMSYSYDNVGNVRSMTDTINGSLGIATTREYDALNRLTTNAQGNKRVDYTYNAISQVITKYRYSDNNLVAETNHIYDQSDRLINIIHSNGANTISSYAQT